MKKIILLLTLLLCSFTVWAQKALNGVVTTADGKEQLIGVTVIVEGTNNGTTTGIDGSWTLKDVKKGDVLLFSMIGYESAKMSYNGQTFMSINLKEAATELDDVVVVGYGVVKKSDLTSSISVVKGDEIKEQTTGNAMNSIQGKINGVQVVTGGGPGASPRVLIRGVTTVNGSSPLYVVDGMPVGGNINFLNNDDIQSMEVLKDASAAAIYGTRGSNGVILITTKRGKKGAAQFNFTASVGLRTLKKPDMAGAAEYEQVFKNRYLNDGRTAPWNGKNASETDWWDETINSVALMQNYSLSFQGGSEKFTYSGSVGYYRDNSQYDYGYWDKLSARFNNEYRFNDHVKFGVDLAPRMESWDDTPNLFGSIMAMDPTTPVMRPQSEWTDNVYSNYSRSHNNEQWNPVASLRRMNSSTRNYGLLLNPFLQIEPVKGLTLRTQFGLNASFTRSKSFTPDFYIDALEKNDRNRVTRNMNQSVDWNWSNTISYMTSIREKHNFNVMAGFTAEKSSYEWLDGSRENIPNNNPNMQEITSGTKNQTSNGNSSCTTLVSYLGRLMYNYDNRYYITASVRADGSSRFPKGNKYAVFPAVSLAWRVIGENFMKNQQLISNLKVRAGWGRVGNQSISDGAFISQITSANGNVCTDYTFGMSPDRWVGSSLSSIGNNTLKWETVEDYNLGIDLSMFNSRFDVTFDLFTKKSTDMLYEKQNIYAVGYPSWMSTVWTNIGSMKASGWELSLNWSDKVKDFSYSVGLNLSGVKNKAVKFSGNGPVDTASFNEDKIIRNADGQEISRFYGYIADGLFQTWSDVYAHSDEHGQLLQPNAMPGDIRFRDLNNDGVINEQDKTYLGSGFPDLMLGLNLSLAYKGFDLSANFYGTFGNEIYNTTRKGYSGFSGENVYRGTLDRAWHGCGTGNDIPRLSANDSNLNYVRVSSFYVEDGSYFRCKQLQLGYTIPNKRHQALKMRFTFSVQNLFTITDYSGMDPERPQMSGGVLDTGIDWTSYPNPRTFLFGADFKF